MTTVRADAKPLRVEQALGFLRERGIWHLASRNPPVGSCREAAVHRRRRGTIGIPLRDELKSLLYAYRDDEGARRYALLHCRAHQRLDLAKVSAVLQAKVDPVPHPELAATFGATYGTVTPMLFTGHPDLVHVVDITVFERRDPPFTMMTNAGDLEHAVEFRPRDLFGAMPGTLVRDIVVIARREGEGLEGAPIAKTL